MVEPAGAFAGQHILITGATGGIGSVLASKLAFEGCRISAVARRRDRLEDLREWIESSNGICFPISKDVTDDDACEFIISRATAEFGPIDSAFLSAGYIEPMPIELTNSSQITKSVELNLLAPVRLTSALLPSMLRRGAGRICAVSSVLGIFPVPFLSVYNAAKSGLIAFYRTLKHELRGAGVSLTCVAPRAVDTALINSLKDTFNSLGWGIDTPEQTAYNILRATALRKGFVISGGIEKAIPVISVLFPALINKQLDLAKEELRKFL